jgi:hypothetical protein
MTRLNLCLLAAFAILAAGLPLLALGLAGSQPTLALALATFTLLGAPLAYWRLRRRFRSPD